MPRKKIKVHKGDSRVLLSDVLPYELPPSYNNLGMYRFFNECKIQYREDGIYAKKIDFSTDVYLSIVLGRVVKFPPDSRVGCFYRVTSAKDARAGTIPFLFTVRHRDKGFRTLAVPHPAAQLEIVDFYSRFSEMILYHTSKSQFSLRHPSKIARYSMVRDVLFDDDRGGEDLVENDRKEYEWLRSYFSYRRYTNVYYFYDSKEYRELERRFGYLVKADIAKCFDSIYTHSIEWATHGRRLAKNNLGRKSSGSFGSEFDGLMQRLNYNETSGITIGSEVSRIFSEIILQAIDVELRRKLSSLGMESGYDYRILRYVDDYFIFMADPKKRLVILEQLSRCLRAYKLHLNTSKEEGKSTPWLSPLSVAKHQVNELIQRGAAIFLEDSGVSSVPRAFAKANQLVTLYKGVLIDTGVEHYDLANYTLARCERAIEKVVKRTKNILRKKDIAYSHAVEVSRSATVTVLNFLEFMFFAYSGAPRMSPTVKLARAISLVLRYSRLKGVPKHDKEEIEVFFREELTAQLRRVSQTQTPDAVTATLVDCFTDLGTDFLLPENELSRFFGFLEDGGGEIAYPDEMNSIILFSILLHIRDAEGYEFLRKACEKWIWDIQARGPRDGELAIVNLNIISCPYVPDSLKAGILGSYNIFDRGVVGNIISQGKGWNVSWRDFDLYSTLQRKRMHDVY
ncbi:antiviral reverse transcriptase Drt3b [Nocardiopsis sp. HUAS JQ3]|uniref:antiviral reverse transcriptase Drt3b n=1 Tax=Nocardiopsis sp. HUAS JQ3 TaxID=3061629 RepID=UPI0023A9D1DF|nr:antiviral reverse transcriptase Drt3b [Nocardiopsis sp. HUAS JQ3]WDZ91092.1 RNA-directed DNA polymerase [Nocardiopsis sp. HUAS JQ3]